jgi:hypothetical protein
MGESHRKDQKHRNLFGSLRRREPNEAEDLHLQPMVQTARRQPRHDPGRESRAGYIRGWQASDAPRTIREAVARMGRS